MQQLVNEERAFQVLANRFQAVNDKMQRCNQQRCPPKAHTQRKQPSESKGNQRMNVQMPRLERIVGLALAGLFCLQIEVADKVRQKLQYEEFAHHDSKFSFSKYFTADSITGQPAELLC